MKSTNLNHSVLPAEPGEGTGSSKENGYFKTQKSQGLTFKEIFAVGYVLDDG